MTEKKLFNDCISVTIGDLRAAMQHLPDNTRLALFRENPRTGKYEAVSLWPAINEHSDQSVFFLVTNPWSLDLEDFEEKILESGSLLELAKIAEETYVVRVIESQGPVSGQSYWAFDNLDDAYQRFYLEEGIEKE